MLTLNQTYITNSFNLPGTDLLVLVNGVYQPQLSTLSTNNKQLWQDTTLKIPKNTVVTTPLHLLFLTTQDCQNHCNIIAEKDSYTTIIEEHASLGNNSYYTEFKTNITAKNASEIIYYKVREKDLEQTSCHTTTSITQEKNSKITHNIINKIIKKGQDILSIKLSGENACFKMQEINMLHNHQNIGDQIRIEHLASKCTSNVLSKSIIDDHASNNFDCRVIVHNSAPQTKTNVTNKNLLLSEFAIANTAPELEIYNDDVICTHGATVGQLDHDALFYLRSRGIAKTAAINMLIAAFTQEITSQFINYDRLKLL